MKPSHHVPAHGDSIINGRLVSGSVSRKSTTESSTQGAHHAVPTSLVPVADAADMVLVRKRRIFSLRFCSEAALVDNESDLERERGRGAGEQGIGPRAPKLRFGRALVPTCRSGVPWVRESFSAVLP